MKRARLYWLCQAGGWTGHMLFYVLAMWLQERLALKAVPFILGSGLTGLVCSHGLRAVIKRSGWTELPLRALIPRALAGILGFTLCATILSLATIMSIGEEMQTRFVLLTGSLLVNWCMAGVGWSLCYFGIQFFWNYQQVNIEKWRMEAAAKDSELKALKSQVNPHFIFNMLNSIRALIVEDPERAQQVVTRMARLLRASLGSDKPSLIPLRDELNTVRDYLELESIRLEERLCYAVEAEPGTEETAVPAMMVQTLVENGVKHGIATLSGGGQITVYASIEEGRLVIGVTNTGRLNKHPSNEGIGLNNARKRLALHYGERASLQIADKEPDLVAAQIAIPLEAR